MDILSIIERLNNTSLHKNPVYAYTHGECLEFAERLKSKTGGIILFLPEEKHFIVSVSGKLYDATGNVTKKYRFAQKKEFSELLPKQLRGYCTNIG